MRGKDSMVKNGVVKTTCAICLVDCGVLVHNLGQTLRG
jgi:anaerobic selenocysteine-containing dehydrogenase